MRQKHIITFYLELEKHLRTTLETACIDLVYRQQKYRNLFYDKHFSYVFYHTMKKHNLIIREITHNKH